jgi:hypothetical protein
VEKRNFPARKRAYHFRDPKLIIIASEGTKTEKKYFEDLAYDHFRSPKVYVEVIDRESQGSSPSQVLEDLSEIESKFSFGHDDQLWLVIDRDRWKTKDISAVAAQCLQKCFFLAVSNPCFELWLLLHVKTITDYAPEEIIELTKNARHGSDKTRLEQELTSIIGYYNKSNLDTSIFFPHIDHAITQARVLDTEPGTRWPNTLGSGVYLLVESIKKSC